MSVKIIADSTCDLSKELLEKPTVRASFIVDKYSKCSGTAVAGDNSAGAGNQAFIE